ncbi:MAG: zinc-ribbon domain-containing protein [Rhodobacter sp.]|nr:zinc-ribbon domain-containing protein [Rhodobacter sp.]
MRLICPNCGAQYEVDDAVIPDSGRDVQCSNCGHTWFQHPAHLDEELAEELDQEGLADESPDAGPDDDQPDDDGGLRRRGIDPDVASILRAEAEHEAEVRKAQAEGLETQTDLGLEDTAEESAGRSSAARARMARLRGLDETSADAEAAALAAAGGSRRDLLPDVEEINSTLRASQDRDESEPGTVIVDDPVEEEAKRRGGRLARTLVILVVVLAVLVYLLAPRIIEAVPQAEPYLTQYVSWANAIRARINDLVSGAIGWGKGLIGQSGES